MYVSYLRASSASQSTSFEIQRTAIYAYLGCEPSLEFTEIASSLSNYSDLPVLQTAVRTALVKKSTLVVYSVDRLTRNPDVFDEVKSLGVDVIFTQQQHLSPDNIRNLIYLEGERLKINNQRTKDGLSIAKSKGVVLGSAGAKNLRANIEARQERAKAFAQSLAGVFEGFKLRGLTQREMVAELNQLGIKAARGGQWSLVQVQRILNSYKEICNG